MTTLPAETELEALHAEALSAFGISAPATVMDNMLENDEDLPAESPWKMAGRESYVSIIGEIAWRSAPDGAVPARIETLPNGELLGYIQVPSYAYPIRSARDFALPLERMVDRCDVLLVDQLNHPGGELLLVYELVRHLITERTRVPLHEFNVWPEDEAQAHNILKRAAKGALTPEEARPSAAMVAYARELVDAPVTDVTSSGQRKQTRPIPLLGVELLDPVEKPFRGRVWVLCHERTFSAGEFFAAILQDSGRGRIVGSTIAGAGCCGRAVKMPELPGLLSLGIAGLTMSWTMGWRANGKPLENRGVVPDVAIELTADDLRHDFQDYRRKLREVVQVT